MLCYVMLCYVMLRDIYFVNVGCASMHVMLCYVMFLICYVLLHNVLLRYVLFTLLTKCVHACYVMFLICYVLLLNVMLCSVYPVYKVCACLLCYVPVMLCFSCHVMLRSVMFTLLTKCVHACYVMFLVCYILLPTLILRRIGILMSPTIISLMQVSLGNILFSIKI